MLFLGGRHGRRRQLQLTRILGRLSQPDPRVKQVAIEPSDQSLVVDCQGEPVSENDHELRHLNSPNGKKCRLSHLVLAFSAREDPKHRQ
jgi:hypothetical protein